MTRDVEALQAATVLAALVGEILEAGKASDAELAVFVPALYESLSEVISVAARNVADNPTSDLRQYGESARGIGAALRDMRA
ncbi:hypothetical protein [Streptomyces cadmiisoli]|uniref:Uncharacterized protein n=1 Tax=Streptomyces cadmiisoli TaxID=2184053 RepID=A0A2Z4J0T2_9ACTN|nr:hypothetical protein [Streptomyces cadmiisoli]AWW38398.1 hypothetical protein DN051_18500 [Streptomyces cadmiisoli]